MNVYVLTIANTCTPLCKTRAHSREEAGRVFDTNFHKLNTWGWDRLHCIIEEFKGTSMLTHPYVTRLPEVA